MSAGTWRPAYVALGSNLAGPRRQVERAFAALTALPGTQLISRSGLWRSAPMGPQDQPPFANAAAGLLTQQSAPELLTALKGIEREMGRTEPAVRWGPRVIDLDLVVFSDVQVEGPGLTLPHPGLHQRNFVLYPLSEIAPELWVPGLDRVSRLRERVATAGIERLAARGTGDD